MVASDEEIIKLLKSEEARRLREGYQLLVHAHADGLTTYIKNQLTSGSIKGVGDIRMEAMTIFVMNVQQGKFRGEASIRTFLFRVAYNLCIKEYKAAKKLDLDTLIQRLQTDQTEESPFVGATEILGNALKQLSEKCQELIRAFYWSGWTQKDIASELGKNEKAVKQQLYRCKEKLKTLVKIK